MTETRTEDRASGIDDTVPDGPEPAELVARIDQLEAELQDLHDRYQRIRQSQYRGTAVALGLIGLAAVAGAWALPGSRQILMALGGTGLFAAVLIYFLTPERFIAADVGERVYGALAANHDAIVTELGLQDTRVYVPTSGDPAEASRVVHLFVPQRREFEVPPGDALNSRFVLTTNEAHRGMSFEPSAAGLIDEFEATLSTELSDSPGRLATQLIDGLVNGFELVDVVTPEVSPAEGRARFAVSGSAYGRVDRFDNPITSFLAVGFARGIGVPVTVTVSVPESPNRAEFFVTCEWSAEIDDRPPTR